MIIDNKVFHKDKIYNSLDWAKENIDSAPDGSVFLADIHEYTKGRQDRSWIWDKDQLAVTILLKPSNLNKINLKDIPLRLNQLNMAITLGILKPLRKFNIELKWANDFYFEGKKLGGVLSQAVWKKNRVAGIIIGFALNVNNKVPKLNQPYYKAISLSEIVGKKSKETFNVIDKDLLFNEILESINFFYKKWLNSEFNEIFDQWKKSQDYLNRQVTVHKKDHSWITGTFINVLENGDMQIKKKSEIIQIPFHMVDNSY